MGLEPAEVAAGSRAGLDAKLVEMLGMRLPPSLPDGERMDDEMEEVGVAEDCADDSWTVRGVRVAVCVCVCVCV